MMMDRLSPILFIEKDPDDQSIYGETLQQAVKELQLKNQVLVFSSLQEAINAQGRHSRSPSLLIHSMAPRDYSALEARIKFQENPTLDPSNFPLVLLADVVNQELLRQAYLLQVQGVFEKPSDLKSTQQLIYFIIGYWQHCRFPR